MYQRIDAYAALDADACGSVKVRELADMIVWGHSLMAIDLRAVLEMDAALTIVDGKMVDERWTQAVHIA